nr:hypothetical protein [uncultured Draconibacterium sp.]
MNNNKHTTYTLALLKIKKTLGNKELYISWLCRLFNDKAVVSFKFFADTLFGFTKPVDVLGLNAPY